MFGSVNLSKRIFSLPVKPPTPPRSSSILFKSITLFCGSTNELAGTAASTSLYNSFAALSNSALVCKTVVLILAATVEISGVASISAITSLARLDAATTTFLKSASASDPAIDRLKPAALFSCVLSLRTSAGTSMPRRSAAAASASAAFCEPLPPVEATRINSPNASGVRVGAACAAACAATGAVGAAATGTGA